MEGIIKADRLLKCPECQAILPNEINKNPWCICGWSSTTEQIIQDIPKPLRRKYMRDREQAQWLASMDAKALSLLEHPFGKLLWQVYLIITLLLCLPIFLAKVIFFRLLFVGWGYALYLRLWFLVYMMALFSGAILLIKWLSRPEPENLGIQLTPHTAPQLSIA